MAQAAKTRSAGVLLYRYDQNQLQVLVGHPGGPFWRNRHEGAWSIPKGLVEPGEDETVAARREFEEETGQPVAGGHLLALGETKLKSGKTVVVWAQEGDFDVALLRSNPVSIEWPRGSGRTLDFPEIDELRWCSLSEGHRLLNSAQRIFLDRLQESLDHVE